MNKPAFWFHLADHENFFHYLNDALLLVLATLNDTGLTPAHMLRCAIHELHSCADVPSKYMHASPMPKQPYPLLPSAIRFRG